MRLSPNFERSEFERDGCVMPDEDVVTAYVELCVNVLEPIRAQFPEPMYQTSGYRDKANNARVTGDSRDSQHIADKNRAATDFYLESYRANMQPVFDWIRMQSGLPFDQVILEHGKHGDVIHISWVRESPRRMALEGATFHQSGYEARYVAPITQGGTAT